MHDHKIKTSKPLFNHYTYVLLKIGFWDVQLEPDVEDIPGAESISQCSRTSKLRSRTFLFLLPHIKAADSPFVTLVLLATTNWLKEADRVLGFFINDGFWSFSSIGQNSTAILLNFLLLLFGLTGEKFSFTESDSPTLIPSPVLLKLIFSLPWEILMACRN